MWWLGLYFFQSSLCTLLVASQFVEHVHRGVLNFVKYRRRFMCEVTDCQLHTKIWAATQLDSQLQRWPLKSFFLFIYVGEHRHIFDTKNLLRASRTRARKATFYISSVKAQQHIRCSLLYKHAQTCSGIYVFAVFFVIYSNMRTCFFCGLILHICWLMSK